MTLQVEQPVLADLLDEVVEHADARLRRRLPAAVEVERDLDLVSFVSRVTVAVRVMTATAAASRTSASSHARRMISSTVSLRRLRRRVEPEPDALGGRAIESVSHSHSRQSSVPR